MDEEDDDFYGPGHDEDDSSTTVKRESHVEDNGEQMDVTDDGQANKDDDDDDDDDDDSDDSDDGFQITLEKPEGAKPNPPAGAKHLLRPTGVRTASGTPDVPQPTGTPTNASGRSQGNSAQPLKVESQRSAAPSATKGALTHGGKEGKDFPEVRTSSIDVEANPIWGGDNGKPLMEVDIDADLAEHSKPWRLPGTDQTDFFNYGFDEYTWTQYCVRQQAMAGTIAQQKDADAQMKAFFGGGGGPQGAGAGPGGGMPGMPPGMPGMPDPAQMMEMMNQGVIPPEFAQMMQMGGMPGMPPFGNGPQGGQFNGMGGPQQGGGGYDSNPNSVSPQPPGQGGFQPPTGPSGAGVGPQGFPPPGMEGYSPQQLAIMQDQQSGVGRGGRNRRGGRGYY